MQAESKAVRLEPFSERQDTLRKALVNNSLIHKKMSQFEDFIPGSQTKMRDYAYEVHKKIKAQVGDVQ